MFGVRAEVVVGSRTFNIQSVGEDGTIIVYDKSTPSVREELIDLERFDCVLVFYLNEKEIGREVRKGCIFKTLAFSGGNDSTVSGEIVSLAD